MANTKERSVVVVIGILCRNFDGCGKNNSEFPLSLLGTSENKSIYIYICTGRPNFVVKHNLNNRANDVSNFEKGIESYV